MKQIDLDQLEKTYKLGDAFQYILDSCAHITYPAKQPDYIGRFPVRLDIPSVLPRSVQALNFIDAAMQLGWASSMPDLIAELRETRARLEAAEKALQSVKQTATTNGEHAMSNLSNLHAIVERLVGPIDPVGETREDERRFENLEALISLVDNLLGDLDRVGRNNNGAPEFSRKKATIRINKFFSDLRDTDDQG